MKITNYTMKEFLQLTDATKIEEYLLLLKHLHPANSIKDPNGNSLIIKRVDNLSFGKVNQMRDLMFEATLDSVIQAFSILTGIQSDEVSNIRITDFWGVRNRIEKEILEIIEREKILTSEETDPVMIEAKVGKRLAKFGVINTLDNLAGGDITKYKEIEDLPYLLVFAKLLREKELAEIKIDIEAIQKRNK
ncbi:MAG: hypothetical protein DI539_16070 [Flavobacterium psychrophilum]|nr:MAG: hypothetical protein DI539_16070 [Flavobacterium psychrophilum]